MFAIRAFLQTIESDPEMDTMKRDLRHRIDDGLSRIEIETLTGEILAEQGRKDISPGRLAERHLSQWVSTLNVKSSKTDLLAEARKLIERTISEIREAAPFSGKQIMEILGIPAGHLVGELMRYQHSLIDAGVKDPQELLNKLQELLDSRR